MKIQLRRGTATEWTAANPILNAGEIGVNMSTSPNTFKIGDGSTPWADLAYAGGGGSGSAAWGAVTGTLSSQTDLATALSLKFDVADAQPADGIMLKSVYDPDDDGVLNLPELAITAATTLEDYSAETTTKLLPFTLAGTTYWLPVVTSLGGGGGGPTTFTDNFTGSSGALTAHSSDSGHDWGGLFATAGAVSGLRLNGSGLLYCNFVDGGSSGVVTDFATDTEDQTVIWTAAKGTTTSGSFVDINLRVSGEGTDSATGYLLRYYEGTGYSAFRFDNSVTYTAIGSAAAGTLSNGDVITCSVSGTGATVTLTMLKNGVSALSVTDTSGGRIVSSSQRVGITILSKSGNSTDDIRVTSLTAQ